MIAVFSVSATLIHRSSLLISPSSLTRFLPSLIVEPIFESLSYCASLHPDPNMSEDEDDFGMGDDAFVDTAGFETFNGTDGEELSEVGRVRSDFVNNNRFAPY